MWPQSLKYLLLVLYRKHLLTPALLPRWDMVCLPGRDALHRQETFEGCKMGSQNNLDHDERDFQGFILLLYSRVNWSSSVLSLRGAQISFLDTSSSYEDLISEDYDKNRNQIIYCL